MFCVNRDSWLCLTHWGWVTHICVGKLTIIGSDNGLSLERHQAILWTNAGILLIESLGTNFSEILIEIQTFSLKKIRLKMSSTKCRLFRLGLNVLTVNVYLIFPRFVRHGYHVWFKQKYLLSKNRIIWRLNNLVFNSLAPGWYGYYLDSVIFTLISRRDIFSISC